MKEIMSSYFTDEEMITLGLQMGVRRVDKAEDVRVAVIIMAAVEAAMDHHLSIMEIDEAVRLAAARRMLRDALGKHHQE